MKIIDEDKIKEFIYKKKLDDYYEELFPEICGAIENIVNEKAKKYLNKKRIVNNDNSKNHYLAKDTLTSLQISSLPSWVKKDINNAVIVGDSKNVIQIGDGRKYHIKNSLNDLSGGEWTYFLNSVISTRFSTGGEDGLAFDIRSIHPSPKPPQLMMDIIKFFTKEGEWVFDYFMGVGGTLLGASMANRHALGIDLEEKYIKAYKEASKKLNLNEQVSLRGDSIKILKQKKIINDILKNKKFSLILIDPPYGDMMSRKKTGEAAKKKKDTSATPFTNLDNDLGNFSWEKFRDVFKNSVVNAMEFLKPRGHVVVFIKDFQPEKGNVNLLHADLINDLNNINGLNYLGTKIWADLGVNLYPYGYPYSYVSNQIHQYILIFRKD